MMTFCAVFAVGLFIGLAKADGPKPCVSTNFKHAKVKKACASGGQSAAKKLMKAAVKKAKASGKKMDCKTCHTKLAPDFPLKPDALQKFKDYSKKISWAPHTRDRARLAAFVR